MTDAELADSCLWHDKRVLYTLLNQPFLTVPAGTSWLKPAISEEGLGYQAQRLDLPISVIVPEATGDYLNVDVNDGKIYSWSASRDEVKFNWFKYLGEGHRRLTTAQLGAITKLQYYGAKVFNVEFIGDTVIEAHARLSDELLPTIQLEENNINGWAYCLPVFGSLPKNLPKSFKLKKIEEAEAPVKGKTRRYLLYAWLQDDEEADNLARQVG